MADSLLCLSGSPVSRGCGLFYTVCIVQGTSTRGLCEQSCQGLCHLWSRWDARQQHRRARNQSRELAKMEVKIADSRGEESVGRVAFAQGKDLVKKERWYE